MIYETSKIKLDTSMSVHKRVVDCQVARVSTTSTLFFVIMSVYESYSSFYLVATHEMCVFDSTTRNDHDLFIDSKHIHKEKKIGKSCVCSQVA